MSSDEIFAAQMWPWPDPMLKRNAQGGILFVNAAFLRIYGGSVHDWHGNCVSGWPAPQGGTTPNRFETRLPSAEGERIYDWVEYTLADGGALSLGRDVTELLTIAAPVPAALPIEQEAVQAVVETHIPEQPALELQAQAPLTPPVQETAPQLSVPAIETPAFEAPVFEAPAFEAPAIEIPAVQIPQIEAPAFVPTHEAQAVPAVQEQIPVAPEVQTTAQTAAPVETVAALQPTVRDYERRALPIENQDAVLGTNWRDAVIAKAVGDVMQSSDAPEAAESEVAAPMMTNAEGPLRILLAEDNAINALLTRTLLEADGCHVDVVEDGVLAVEAMKKQSYDMIFMDMRMPNMDGLESTRKIRTLPNVPKSLPIVALTANAFDDDRNACFDSGMNDFMTKPVSAEELQDMVARWARKEAQAA